MSSNREQNTLAKLAEEVDKTSSIESELGLIFYLNPVNRDELMDELSALAGGTGGNGPLLTAEYPPLEFDTDQMYSRLDALERGPASVMGDLWNMRINQLRRQLELLEARGRDHFTGLAVAEYGSPSRELVAWSAEILDDPLEATRRLVSYVEDTSHMDWPAPPPPVEALSRSTGADPADPEGLPGPVGLDADSARSYLEGVIRHYRLDGVDVQITDRLTARAAVEGGRLWLRDDILFDKQLLRRLAVHEVGVHLRRRARRSCNRHPLLEMESPHGPGTEEGLTVLAEARAGCLEPEVLKTYAGRVVAIEHSLKKGAAAVADFLTEKGFEPDEAATLLMRAKRGTADFSDPGAFPKDLCYLEGAQRVLNYIRQGGTITPMLECLLGIEDLPYLPPYIVDFGGGQGIESGTEPDADSAPGY